MGQKHTKICSLKGCGVHFETSFPNKIYCSKVCRGIAKNSRLPTTVLRLPKVFECPYCKVRIHTEDIKR